MVSKLNILFFLYQSKINRKSEMPIFCRITLDGKRKQFSCGLYVKKIEWDFEHSNVIERDAETKYINDRIRSIKKNLLQSYSALLKKNDQIDVQKLYDQFLGKSKSIRTIIGVFDYHIQQIKELIGKDYSLATHGKFVLIRRHLSEFILQQYNLIDVSLTSLKLGFLQDFEHHLKTRKAQNQNTVNKTLERVRKIIGIAIAHGWLSNDPFALFRKKRFVKEVVFLDSKELDTLEKCPIPNRLNHVRNIFLFSCYTGLAYNELSILQKIHLKGDKSGLLWIEMIRKKTKRPISVPILPKALNILESYNYNKSNGPIFNPISNQKLNEYLKEVASELGISKNLTHHVARKTFATTVLLGNDIPIDVASFLLGHSRISTTEEFYVKVQRERVVFHFDKLADLE